MSTTSIGRQAEQKASDHLTKQYGYRLLSQNWRTRTCEIDLIMQQGDTIHFIEVKFRKNNFAGGGLSSISRGKLKKMHQASLEWVQLNPNYRNFEVNISAIEISGNNLKVTKYIDSIYYDD
jgi:uncharacterized protein (TIGR00252 family)